MRYAYCALQRLSPSSGCIYRYEENLSLIMYFSVDYDLRAMLTACPASLIEGRAHETILEDGARRGVLRQRLATAASGGTGPRPPGTTTGREELAVTDPEAIPVREARDRSPKSPRWSAGRRASPVWDARRLIRRLACRVTCRPNGCLASTRRLSALRHPFNRGSEAKVSKPGRKNAPRERRGVAWCERFQLVIPAVPRWRREPESITTGRGYGFRAR